MDTPPTLSILIVNYKTPKMTRACLDSITQFAGGIDHEVIVVDNHSQDESADIILKSHPEVAYISMDRNAGFGAANNRAAEAARGRYLLLLNNDAFLTDHSLSRLITTLEENPDIAAVGPEIRYPDGRFQLSCGSDLSLTSEFFMKHHNARLANRIQQGPLVVSVDWISGACMLIPRTLYTQVGGFDETFFLYIEDADLCRRLRKLGYRIVLDRRALVHHHLGESTVQSRITLLPAIKRGHLHYYAVHNSRFSLLLLKVYLILRCRWSRSLPAAVKKELMDIIRRSK